MFYHAYRAVSVGFFNVVHVDRSPACNKISNLFSIVSDTGIVFSTQPCKNIAG
jgi:hypothetical protein